MKATAQAPSNIAFIKYWGKADEQLRLPLNSSISMNLSGAYTITTVEFSDTYIKDSVKLLDGTFSNDEQARVIKSLDTIREKSNIHQYARVCTQNTFPKGTGAAASASGFAALIVAGFEAAGVKLSEKEFTMFARMGSGSACRSIPNGFVIWEKGKTSEESYAHSLYPSTYWDLSDILVIVDVHMKKISTTEGQEGVKTSPFWKERVKRIPEKIKRTKNALKEKNFVHLGEIIEEDCLDMHHVMQTQNPPIFYWNDTTKKIMAAVNTWRKDGLPVYFTIDAGPNVHLICLASSEQAVIEKVKKISGVLNVIANKPSIGTRLTNAHLF